MRVTALELFAVPPRWLFLKLSTDEGIAGWGEPIVEGRAATVRAAVEEMGEWSSGGTRSGSRTTCRSCGAAASTAAGRSCAVHLGHRPGAVGHQGPSARRPVYELLGGAVRDRMRVYAWIGGDRPAEVGAAGRAGARPGSPP